MIDYRDVAVNVSSNGINGMSKIYKKNHDYSMKRMPISTVKPMP